MIYMKFVTRAVLASTDLFTGLSKEIGIYTADMKPIGLPSDPDAMGQIPLVFYEVSADKAGAGSWWLPVSPVPDPTTRDDVPVWGDWSPLKASGDISVKNLLRPAERWCWVPVDTVDQYLTPAEIGGTISGPHPNVAPLS